MGFEIVLTSVCALFALGAWDIGRREVARRARDDDRRDREAAESVARTSATLSIGEAFDVKHNALSAQLESLARAQTDLDERLDLQASAQAPDLSAITARLDRQDKVIANGIQEMRALIAPLRRSLLKAAAQDVTPPSQMSEQERNVSNG